MTAQEFERVSHSPPLGMSRLVIGLAQGLAGFGLHKAWDAKTWPATEPALFWALALSVAFVPLILLGALGAVRRRTLAVWTIAAALLTAGLAVHDILRQATGQSPVYLSFPVIIATAAALFIAHHLVTAADHERKWIAPYPSYFDAAWKDGVQLALSVLFVGVFWAVLELGAALFNVIGIKAFGETINKDWFGFPATGVVFAAAVHLTDVRVGIIRGIRTVVLALLSWLMPLMALIAAAFLLALPFTGLTLLWRTGHSSSILLSAAAALIVLINAAYQDADAERRPPMILRHAGRLAALVLTPIVGLALYGLWLRVGQYGWTADRVVASACALVGTAYAVGYLVAALKPGGWLKPLEPTNIATAFLALVVIIALCTPIADPDRIAVGDQLGRLESGRVAPEKFDFAFLRFRAARYGVEALHRLQARTTGPNAAVVAQKAGDELRRVNPWETPTASATELGAGITVYPKGKTLPESFLRQHWEGVFDPCLQASAKCDAFFVDLDGDGADEILLTNGSVLNAYRADASGAWASLGMLNPMNGKLVQALREGRFKVVEPHWKDLEVDGHRLSFGTAVPGRLTPMTMVLHGRNAAATTNSRPAKPH